MTIGDENTPEQFILGQLYYQALKAEGFAVTLNQNIGPTEVTMQALANGRLAMYPEYLDTFNTNVAGIQREFRSRRDAYRVGPALCARRTASRCSTRRRSATRTRSRSRSTTRVQNDLQSIPDLIKVASQLTLGGPPQFQQSPTGLPALEATYGVVPSAFKPLELGAQYQALDQGTVQAAVVQTTDRPARQRRATRCCATPSDVFGWGNVVPVVHPSARSTRRARRSRPRSIASARC